MAVAYAPVPVRHLGSIRPHARGSHGRGTRSTPMRASRGLTSGSPQEARGIGGPRLTVRGRRLVALCCAAGVLAVLAVLPWRAVADEPAGTLPTGWTAVTVSPGDTLWSFAQSADPGADPRPIIAEIRAVNGLDTSTLQPGMRLAVPAP